MIIAFTGHRDRRADPARFEALAEEFPGAIWRHGAASEGFDRQVTEMLQQYGWSHGVTPQVYRPRYHEPPLEPKDRLPVLWPEKYRGAPWVKVAPLKRNEEMLVGREGDGAASFLVACWDGRRSGGTFYTKEYAEWMRCPVRVWEPSAG